MDITAMQGQLPNTDIRVMTIESGEKGEKGEKIQNEIQNEIQKQKINEIPLDINSFDIVNYITLETMSNNDSYNKYLKRNKMDHDAVLKREKKFYRKRIVALTKDILFNNITTNANTNQPPLSESLSQTDTHTHVPKIDDIIISSFNTYARLCISHFKFKDTMDTIQCEYKDMNHETFLNDAADTADIDDIDDHDDMANHVNEANKLCMKQNDKKILTLDNYVIKTSVPKKEIMLPKTKNVNLKDPKFKKKDIKVSMSASASVPTSTSTSTSVPTSTPIPTTKN